MITWIYSTLYVIPLVWRTISNCCYAVCYESCDWRNCRHLVSLPRRVQRELPQKEEATKSSLPSPHYGSPDSKKPTDDVKTIRSGRVARPPISLNLKHVLFCFDRCDVKESDLTFPLMRISFTRLIIPPN